MCYYVLSPLSNQEHLNVRILKPSTTIRSRQTREILRAGRHAWKIERDLNLYVVVNFNAPAGDELRPQKLFREIRRKVQSWMYYKRRVRFMDPLTDIRTWENRNGIYHVNWALHVPAEFQDEFRAKLPIWVEKALGYLSTGCYAVTDVYNINALMRYMLKGTQKAATFGIKHVPQGEVYGRRAAAATCLGKAARVRDATSGMVARESKRRRAGEAKSPAAEAGL